MSDTDRKYWFPAKRYGWGWGWPVAWQGWLVTGAWVIAVAVVSLLTLVPTQRWWLFSLSLAGLVIALVIMCYAKGEPPRWRWGDD